LVAKEGEMTELNLQVEGMDCGGCEDSIRKAVSQIEGVKSVSANHSSGKVQVVFAGDVDETGVRSAIEDAGYEVVGVG
jgi:copper ion binding protein